MSTAHVTKLKRKAADFEQKKQLDKALALYIQLVDSAGRDLDDADLQIYNRVGDLLMRQSSVSEALAYYEKAVDLYAERGYLNNAIALCNKILRQSPARTVVYYKLGKISANKGFKSDARKNFLEYADRMQKAGDTDEAFRALKEFADLCPDQDDIRLLLADLLTKEQRTDEAVEQLGQLYSKLETEGREAEARATMDRIKAINPEVTPPVSGAYISQKTNDLVFLDLDAPMEQTGRSTPRAPAPIVATPEVVEVSGVGALEGLAVTFFPEELSGDASVDEAAPVDGLEVNALAAGEEVEPLPHLELVGTEAGTPTEPLEGIEFDRPDASEADGEAIVTPVEGLASIGTAITDSHPALAPLLDEPPMTGEEFGALELTVAERESPPPRHDLALPSSLPRMEGDAEEEPHERIAAVAGADALLEVGASQDSDSLVEDLDGADVENATPDAESDNDVVARIAAQLDALGADAHIDTKMGEDEPPLRPPTVPRPPAISPSELAAIRMAHLSDPDAPVDRSALSPEFALEEQSARGDGFPTSALDTSTLSDGRTLRGLGSPGLSRDSAEIETIIDPPARSSLEEDGVELPLLDLGTGANSLSDDDALDDAAIDDLLSTPPSFTSTPEDVGSFEPSPLDFNDPTSTDEWEAQHPEVLIDGEWRDEHVGDLVSGEVSAVGDGADTPPNSDRPAAFDDLAAAMMYDGAAGGTDARDSTKPSDSTGDNEPSSSRRSTVTFGGSEAQLRRRLEGDPANPSLRRQLGEALLDEGHREQGLNELELAVQAYEGQGAYGSAREVVDVILRVSPLSVHHHQKRVEYAVRANNRAQLIGAYTDLADALFRCGEPDKSRVVYSRVLDLDPSNDRARFALGMLSEDAAPGRRSDEVPLIDSRNAGSLPPAGRVTVGAPDPLAIDRELSTLVHLNVGTSAIDAPHSEHAVRTREDAEPLATNSVDDVMDTALDEEVDAAFAEAHALLPDIKAAPGKERVEPVASRDVAPSRANTADNPSKADQDLAAPKAHEDLAVSAVYGKLAEPDVHEEVGAREQKAVAANAHDPGSASKAHGAPVAPRNGRVREDPPILGDRDYVDLGEWLRASEPSRSTRMVSDDVVPTGDENADFAEMLRRFKQGVAANVEDEDYASHYDLGVAFKEMGLTDEAIAQFQKSLRGDDHRVRSYEALGQCFVEQGQFQVATTLLRRALETTRADDQRLVGVLYLLGFSSESMGRHGDAVGYYQRVFAVDIEFRDVSSRLAALERKTQ